jgi:glyoxylase-like metal-dependent hydrolase (beta-lactamase superfamily II)
MLSSRRSDGIESLQLSMRVLRFLIVGAVLVVLQGLPALAQDDGQPVPREQYSNRVVLPDPTAAPCADTPRSLMPIKDDLSRHTNSPLPALHGRFVPITTEGATVIDPALTCTDIWLRDELQSRFNVSVRYIICTHAHFDPIAGAQVFQNDGATVVTHKNAVEPIVAEKLPTAVPDRVFDKAMTIALGGDTVRLFRTRQTRTVDA